MSAGPQPQHSYLPLTICPLFVNMHTNIKIAWVYFDNIVHLLIGAYKCVLIVTLDVQSYNSIFFLFSAGCILKNDHQLNGRITDPFRNFSHMCCPSKNETRIIPLLENVNEPKSLKYGIICFTLSKFYPMTRTSIGFPK